MKMMRASTVLPEIRLMAMPLIIQDIKLEIRYR